MISIEYTVKDHGWAYAQIGNGTIIEEIHASYLHDTLADFANAAIHLSEKKQQTVVFFMEPGESQLILNMINEKEIHYKLNLYKEWTTNNKQRTPFIKLLEGTCTLVNYKNEVRKILAKLMLEMGPELYKERWQMGDFPLAQYEALK